MTSASSSGHHGASGGGGSSRPSHGGRGHTRHGYGEGRGQQYYPPKGVFYKPLSGGSDQIIIRN